MSRSWDKTCDFVIVGSGRASFVFGHRAARHACGAAAGSHPGSEYAR